MIRTLLVFILAFMPAHQLLLAQGQLFGTTRGGGATGGGVLFKTNVDSSTYMEVVKEWVLDVSGATSGTSTFIDTEQKSIKRNDDVVVTVRDVSESQLVLSLTWAQSTYINGRASSIAGAYSFTLNK